MGHVVRISLVQFSASELHEVSSYDRLKVEKVKIRILRRQHLLGSIDCKDFIDVIESEESIQSVEPNGSWRLKILIFTFSTFKRS